MWVAPSGPSGGHAPDVLFHLPLTHLTLGKPLHPRTSSFLENEDTEERWWDQRAPALVVKPLSVAVCVCVTNGAGQCRTSSSSVLTASSRVALRLPDVSPLVGERGSSVEC